MSSAPVTRLVILASLIGACGLAHAAHAAQFSIIDQRGDGEISEETRFYIDGVLVAQARLDGDRNQTVMHVTVPDKGQPYAYSLCGSVTIRSPAGSETHEVNASGLLRHPDGHEFEAMGTSNYTGFYLVDRTNPLSGTVENRAVRSLACAPPSS